MSALVTLTPSWEKAYAPRERSVNSCQALLSRWVFSWQHHDLSQRAALGRAKENSVKHCSVAAF